MTTTAGKMPPNSLDSERIVLGTMMNERGAYDKTSDILTSECFYNNRHKQIYKTICKIKEKGEFPDMIRVSQELGTNYYLEVVDIAGVVSAEMYQHALILKELYIRRKVIQLTTLAAEQSYTNSIDIDETINVLMESIKDIYSEASTGVIHISEAVGSMRENVIENMTSEIKSSGSPTGFREFDEKSGGLQGTDLVIVAGESSMGKTSLALSICNNIAENDNIAVYSLEMSSMQLASRITAMRTGIPANELLYSKLTQDQFERMELNVNRICNLGIFIDERSTSNIDSIIGSIRNMKVKYNITGAMIDYLQIVHINEKGVSEETKLGIAARRLKNLAKELDIWIMALSQLNRNDSNPYPTLGRLRGSGQIGEAADIVAFAYRPEYYGINKQYPEEFAEYTTRGTGLIDVAKGRNIGTFRFLTKFDRQTTHFTEIKDLEVYKIENILTSGVRDLQEETPF